MMAKNTSNQSITRLLFWLVYVLFVLTSVLASHIFTLVFVGPIYSIVYALVALTSFIPYSIFVKNFKAAEHETTRNRKQLAKAWVAFAFSIPLKLMLIGVNLMELIQPSSNHWNFG